MKRLVDRLRDGLLLFLQRARGAWWVLLGKGHETMSAYIYKIPVHPDSWVCTRCGGGFNGSLVPPPHSRSWQMIHNCQPKQPLHGRELKWEPRRVGHTSGRAAR